MKHIWTKRRVLIEHADAQRRWDRAYQMVLMWAKAVAIPVACEANANASPSPPSPQAFQEDNDGSQ